MKTIKQNKNIFSYRNILPIIIELALLFYSFHFARIWDIVHANIIVNDPEDLQKIYINTGTSPFSIAVSAMRIMLSDYCLYLKGVHLRTVLIVFLIMSGMCWFYYCHYKIYMAHDQYVYLEPKRINEPNWKLLREAKQESPSTLVSGDESVPHFQK